MLENIKIYSSDKYWQQIFADLGATVVDNQNEADVFFDDIDTGAPVSIADLKKIIFDCLDHQDIITDIFGQYIILPGLQRKILVVLYKYPNISMRELKERLGFLPDITTHTVENAVYQLRKKYGHDFIQNENGKYRIGRL
ncbi:MAG: helix-turn-helix domain-containing protein [Alphaproteobacteria bacterium]|nr:helix-turn-helix domain-containing protein [Alphaproteobacteria bacterium]